MKLQQWLKLRKMSQTELARLAKTSVSTINRHLKHGRVLDPKVIVRIFFITLGAVRPDDFYDLQACPPDLESFLIAQNKIAGMS
jgi:hypothetical protein